MENSGAANCAWVIPSLVRTSLIFVPTLAATALPTFAVSRDGDMIILPFKTFLSDSLYKGFQIESLYMK